ncbi:YraN family protein [Myxococcota bacterium]|nr:YraN family protein [Myxococcota bacterium]
MKSSHALHLTLGDAGEQKATGYLRRRGYRILGRNVRAGGVELDLIVRRGRVLAFIEVKTRSSRRAGLPELAVDLEKQRRLTRGAQAWLQIHRHAGLRLRFDVIACEVSGFKTSREQWFIRHFEDAFEALEGGLSF